ncbi:MAG: hypothetical protein CTY35_03300 [Methylotenera sp.]|jgi:hypothetical protein|uniref:hypothetical protein n=1 Tax=Methylotenera TaxID=359407 RepID=UPI0003692327|nr:MULTISPECIES: hypothetical protein [Methylotenera]MDP3777576.1 hypothetical protein [Methylotenera sp.]PPC96343.1 MAG: hypothetical protein CTY32_05810 [Methylotenera sp.]PPD00006.1 MAG: hypothetical protein CTY35_03300 [Methylotenera sp.]
MPKQIKNHSLSIAASALLLISFGSSNLHAATTSKDPLIQAANVLQPSKAQNQDTKITQRGISGNHYSLEPQVQARHVLQPLHQFAQFTTGVVHGNQDLPIKFPDPQTQAANVLKPSL